MESWWTNKVRIKINTNNNDLRVSKEKVLLNFSCHLIWVTLIIVLIMPSYNATWVTLIMLSFALIYFLDHQVTAKCGESVANTPWAACLVAEEGGLCPHNFKKLEDDNACIPHRSSYKPRVCCLLGPIIEMKVNKSCYLENTTDLRHSNLRNYSAHLVLTILSSFFCLFKLNLFFAIKYLRYKAK